MAWQAQALEPNVRSLRCSQLGTREALIRKISERSGAWWNPLPDKTASAFLVTGFFLLNEYPHITRNNPLATALR
jgi:hypothetical protein